VRLALTVAGATLRDTGERCEQVRFAGLDALVARPRRGDAPVVVYANACTPLGIEQPSVGRFLGGLARAGFVAVAPELPHVRNGEVTQETVEALVAVATAAGPRVALLGASTGAGLAILAAADPRLAHRATAVAAIAPFASLESMLRLATTGHYGDRPFVAAPLVSRVTARSLAASAPEDPAVAALLANRNPERFSDLFAALAPSTRALVRQLSPLHRIGDVLAPIELLVSPTDRYFPAEEARSLAPAGRDVRLTVTDGLDHVRPRLGPHFLPVLAALERTLRRAAGRDSGAAPTSHRGVPYPGRETIACLSRPRIRVLTTR
jgi:acetyl esterase/lipase